jgi:hypothetical protein
MVNPQITGMKQSLNNAAGYHERIQVFHEASHEKQLAVSTNTNVVGLSGCVLKLASQGIFGIWRILLTGQ